MVLDIFRKPFYFLMPDESEYYSSCLGTCLSILCFLILLSYGGYKIQDLMIYNDYNLFIVNELHYYKDSDPFTTGDGLHIAAGVISFEDDPSVGTKEDPEIGMLKFYLKHWDFNDPVSGGELVFTEVPLRPCQNKDFNNGGGNTIDSKFYPTNEFSKRAIDLYQNSIKCVD